MNKKNIQPVHNESVVQGIASEFWEKDTQGENSLHTFPNGCTICSLCKVGATVPLEETFIHNWIIYNKKNFEKLPPLSDEEKELWIKRGYNIFIPEEIVYPSCV